MTFRKNWKQTTLLSLQIMNFITFRSIGSSPTYLPSRITRLDGKGESAVKFVQSAPISQRSWVQIPYGPEFFSGLISTTSSVVFIAARISYIRFFTAVHIYDFHTSTIIIVQSLFKKALKDNKDP